MPPWVKMVYYILKNMSYYCDPHPNRPGSLFLSGSGKRQGFAGGEGAVHRRYTMTHWKTWKRKFASAGLAAVLLAGMFPLPTAAQGEGLYHGKHF